VGGQRSELCVPSSVFAKLASSLVTQLGRAPGIEPGGWGFKSLGSDQNTEHLYGQHLEPDDSDRLRTMVSLVYKDVLHEAYSRFATARSIRLVQLAPPACRTFGSGCASFRPVGA
jgi:hypothetical protein